MAKMNWGFTICQVLGLALCLYQLLIPLSAKRENSQKVISPPSLPYLRVTDLLHVLVIGSRLPLPGRASSLNSWNQVLLAACLPDGVCSPSQCSLGPTRPSLTCQHRITAVDWLFVVLCWHPCGMGMFDSVNHKVLGPGPRVLLSTPGA